LDNTTIQLFHKTNNTYNDLTYYVNGTSRAGWFTEYYTQNWTNNLFNWSFDDDKIYPGVFPLEPEIMKESSFNTWDLDNKNEFIKIKLVNVSLKHRFNYFELVAENQTQDSTALRIYYCNNSYITGKVADSPHCINFYNVFGDTEYNHTENGVPEYIIPFPIETTTNTTAGDIIVTNESYFIVRGPESQADGWDIGYVSDEANVVEISANSGISWNPFSGTMYLELHQYCITDVFYYFAEACNNKGLCTNSSVQSDNLDVTPLPPTVPIITNPVNKTYGKIINITWLEAISPTGTIENYNITLVYHNESEVKVINGNLTGLNYVWNTNATAEGVYKIKITAYDNQSLSSDGLSDLFSIDNTPPGISNNYTYISSEYLINGYNKTVFNNTNPNNETNSNFHANATFTEATTNLSHILFHVNNTKGEWTNYTLYDYTVDANTTSKNVEINLTFGNFTREEYYEYEWIVNDSADSTSVHKGNISCLNMTVSVEFPSEYTTGEITFNITNGTGVFSPRYQTDTQPVWNISNIGTSTTDTYFAINDTIPSCMSIWASTDSSLTSADTQFVKDTYVPVITGLGLLDYQEIWLFANLTSCSTQYFNTSAIYIFNKEG